MSHPMKYKIGDIFKYKNKSYLIKEGKVGANDLFISYLLDSLDRKRYGVYTCHHSFDNMLNNEYWYTHVVSNEQNKYYHRGHVFMEDTCLLAELIT